MRARAMVLCALAALLAALPVAARGQSAPSVASKHAAAQRLQQTLAAQNRRVAAVQGSIDQVQARLDREQAALSAEQARVGALQGRLRAARARLVRLEQALERANVALTANLVGQYEGNRPDLISVVLSAHGFADLLDTATFLRDVQDRNTRILGADKRARTQVIAQATLLGNLEADAQRRTTAMLAARNRIDTLRLALLRRRAPLLSARNRTSAALAGVRAQEARLQAQLAAVQQRQAATVQQNSGAPVSPGNLLRGGGFVFPMPSGAASPPGTWSLDQGVDISAPGHTPLIAVGSGTVVLHGIGGFGAWAPVLHLDDGRYVYYGHAGPGNAVAIGTHVGAGQVIGEVGAGIVGISTGPHLEIGFSDASGTPSGGAGTMMALLHGAYGG